MSLLLKVTDLDVIFNTHLCLETSILFQIINFNNEIINEEFENDNVWIIILKFSTLTTLKTMVKFDQNLNLKFFYLSNNKFESILNFQIKSLFSNMTLINCHK